MAKVLTEMLTKVLSYINYVPKSWLDSMKNQRDKACEERDLALKLLKLNEKQFTLDIIPDKKRLQTWAKTIKDQANNTCDICGFYGDPNEPINFSKNIDGKRDQNYMTAHHLYDKHIHPSLMYIPENGVALCNECHKAFHSKYTSKSHCTPKLYEKFKNFRQGQIILKYL